MARMTMSETRPAEFSTLVRNRYFYGKLLDVFHFEIETDYMNAKRWLLNRVVTGWGVACGLDVVLVHDGEAIIVTPGLAIDQWGREIIVPTDSQPVWLPGGPPSHQRPWPERERRGHHQHEQSPEQQGDKGGSTPDIEVYDYHVVLCYYECLSSPTPVLAVDCDSDGWCTPGTVEERYRIEIRPDHVDPIDVWDCRIPDAITRGELRYDVLVDWVTHNCPEVPDDPCVPLANLTIRVGGDGPYCEPDDVDITIRQLALSNRALFYLLMSMLYEVTPRSRR